jgi:FkbM family methyltransferase
MGLPTRGRWLADLKGSSFAWSVRRTALWRWFREHPDTAQQRRFWRGLIDPASPGCIIDVGASTGGKSEIFLGLASSVIAVEPDPDAAQLLRRRFAGKPVEVLELAISDAAATLPFYRFAPASAFNTLSRDWAGAMTSGSNHMGMRLDPPETCDVRTETLANVMRRAGQVKYVKIDAEGFEERVISTLAVAVPLVSLEFNLTMAREQLRRAVAHLGSLGDYRFNFCVTEPPVRFELPRWIRGDEFVSHIDEAGPLFAEVFARLE